MEYENRVVVFIDILGFKNIVEKTLDKTGTDLPEKIQELCELLVDARKTVGLDPLFEGDVEINKGSKRITQFSDSIVISFLASEESEVFHTLLNTLYLIMDFLRRGVLCRGGIAYGKLIHNEKVLFGPAIIQAYETESKAALYPRIILDESIINIGAKHHASHHQTLDEREYIMDLVKKDTDDMYYIDYFEGAQGELDEPDYQMPAYIDNLKSIITAGLKYESADLKAKYGWMRNKFNIMVSYFRRPDHIESLRNSENSEYLGLADYYDKLIDI